jgi:hypothetical protein
MAKPIAATPQVRGKDAERIFGRMRTTTASDSVSDAKEIAERRQGLQAARKQFQKVVVKHAGGRKG